MSFLNFISMTSHSKGDLYHKKWARNIVMNTGGQQHLEKHLPWWWIWVSVVRCHSTASQTSCKANNIRLHCADSLIVIHVMITSNWCCWKKLNTRIASNNSKIKLSNNYRKSVLWTHLMKIPPNQPSVNKIVP